MEKVKMVGVSLLKDQTGSLVRIQVVFLHFR